jgi:4-hydroxybenzoyl-CoA reductase subunit beta
MLRLPPYRLLEPATPQEAVDMLAAEPGEAMLLAGGTDLVPNMKHGLFEPKTVVSLAKVEGLQGVTDEAGGLRLGPMTTLADLCQHPLVVERAPALAQAAGGVSGPQVRNIGTLGGNVMLDTRCRWYNQTYFWRKGLGYCLKKDGTLCHVVEGGSRCVAAASNDTAPALMTLNASLVFLGPGGERKVAIADLWTTDGIVNKKVSPDELLVAIHVPAQAAGHRGAYAKLRRRDSIDFPLFGCAVRLDLDEQGRVSGADLAAVALVARPVRLKGTQELLAGTQPGNETFDEAVEAVARLAYKRCRPLDNVPGDAEWRREMVPVYVRRALRAAVAD